MASKYVGRGLPDGRFDPEGPVTREQVAALTARALRASGQAAAPSEEQVATWLAAFDDRDNVAPWARSWMALAVREGIVRGQTQHALAPQAGATRAEAAVMMARYWRK